nr:sensor histidine kinase [Anaerolineae bacterium]
MEVMASDAHKSGKDQVLDMLHGEIEQVTAEVRDISAKVSQSRSQVEQLAQRNAVVIGEVRRIESSLDAVPRMEIREVYAQALDVQQRLLSARGQLEKLQAEEKIARGMVELLENTLEILSQQEEEDDDGSESFNAREMIVRVIDAQEEQSERLARQMHDGPAHSLTNFILQAEICQKLFDRNPEKAREELTNLKTAANEAFQKVRGFIFDLRPMMLSDLGVVPTLKRYLEGYGEKTGIETKFELIGRERRIEHYREVLIFRGVQALLLNARDHSGATSVKVIVEIDDERVRAIVEDNGRGFGTGKLSLNSSNSEALGLGALQERVNLVGGIVRVDSLMGQGAKIEIDIPAGQPVNDMSE